MSSLGAMARGPEQPLDQGGLVLLRPPGLPKGASIRNTFLEFHDECSNEDEGDEDASRALRQCSDSLLEMSGSTRIELEQDRSKGMLAPDTFGRCTVQAAEPEPQPSEEADESPPLDVCNKEVAPRDAPVEASFLATGKGTPQAMQDETLFPMGGTLASAGVRYHEVDDPSDAPSEARLDSGEEVVVDGRLAAARELAARGGGLSGCVTVMVRRIPAKYTQHKLMREINAAGFLGKYDFFYLLMQPHSRGNRGFAFINFISPESGESFYQAFDGKKLRHFYPEHPLSVLPADLQGFEANAEHYARMQSVCAKRPLNCGRALFFRTFPGAPAREAGAAGAIQRAPAKISGSGPDAVGPSLQRYAPVVDTAQRRVCTNCGSSMQASHLFCIFCGTRASSNTSDIGGTGGGVGQISPFAR